MIPEKFYENPKEVKLLSQTWDKMQNDRLITDDTTGRESYCPAPCPATSQRHIIVMIFGPFSQYADISSSSSPLLSSSFLCSPFLSPGLSDECVQPGGAGSMQSIWRAGSGCHYSPVVLTPRGRGLKILSMLT